MNGLLCCDMLLILHNSEDNLYSNRSNRFLHLVLTVQLWYDHFH
jgi:hypothetical protein